MGVHHKNLNEKQDKTSVYDCKRCEKTFEDQIKLDTHLCDPRPVQIIQCEQCDFKSDSVSVIKEHVDVNHRTMSPSCLFCDFEANTHEEMSDHITEKHEELGVLKTLAFHQKYVTESFDSFKDELTTVLNNIITGHNAIKQELFIMRQNQVTDKKIETIEKSVNNLSALVSTHLQNPEPTSSNSNSFFLFFIVYLKITDTNLFSIQTYAKYSTN